MIKPTPMVIIFNMSLLIKARKKNSISPNQIKPTTSSEGSLSETPKIKERIEGTVAQCINTIANHPTVSADILAMLSLKNFFIVSILNCIFSVEDVSSDLSNSWFVPSWVDVVCMIIDSLFYVR